MKYGKIVLAFLLIAAVLVSLCACTGGAASTSTAVTGGTTTSAAASTAVSGQASTSTAAGTSTTSTVSGESTNGAESALALASCSDLDWQLSQDGSYWYVLDVCYVASPVDVDYQTLSIFVPAAYLEDDGSGNIVMTDETVNGYTAETAPILYTCEAPGYSESKASSSADTSAISYGFIHVSPGHRGKGTSATDSNGNTYYDGKSPWCLVDLKAGIRYMRYNDAAIPGSSELIVTSASSGGGAMSSFLACNANDPVYDDYLEAAGAIMSVGDQVYASNLYCPITNVANSDTAYEWFLGTQSHLEALGCTDFQTILSGYLSDAFVTYLSDFGYSEDEFAQALTEQLEWSVNYYFQELQSGDSSVEWTDDAVFVDANNPALDEIAANYIAGFYTRTGGMSGGPGGMPGGSSPSGTGDTGTMPGSAAPSSSSSTTQGEDISAWLAWDEASQSAVITDLTAYEDYYSRQKGVTSFDGLNGNATENQVFGDSDENYKHFSSAILSVLEANYDDLEAAWTDTDAQNTGYSSFADLYADFQKEVSECDSDEYGNNIVDLYNPMLFIDSDTSYLDGDIAEHVRIRMGTADANTSLAIITLLSLVLENDGIDVNMEYVWEGGHGVIEQDNQSLYDWIVEICAS